MRKVFSIVGLFLCLFLYSCGGSNGGSKAPVKDPSSVSSNNLNVSILLDLSDRLKVCSYGGMSCSQCDLGCLKPITDAFTTHVNSKRIRSIDDQIALYVAPTPQNPAVNQIIDSLKINLTKNNVTKPKIAGLTTKYTQLTDDLYDWANSAQNFPGSDTWGFFMTKVNKFCVSDNHRNILVIFTDGYIYDQANIRKSSNKTNFVTSKLIRDNHLNANNWKQTFDSLDCGLMPANQGLENLEVLVLGINPSQQSKNPYEEEVLRHYWESWLESMGVKVYSINVIDLPSNMDKVIKEFILKK